MKTRMKVLLTLLCLLLAAALLPAAAGATSFSGLEVTNLPSILPTAHETPIYTPNLRYSLKPSNDTMTPNADLWGWFTVDNKPASANAAFVDSRLDLSFQSETDYILAISASTKDPYNDVFTNNATVTVASGLPQPYKIETSFPNSVNNTMMVYLYYHTVTDYPYHNGDPLLIPDPVYIDNYGPFKSEVYDGDAPDTNLSNVKITEGAKSFTLSDLKWEQIEPASSATVEKFSAGNKYQVSVVLTPTAYAQFASENLADYECTFYAADGSIFGGNLSLEWVTPKKSIRLLYRPKTATQIKFLEIKGIKTPELYAVPQKDGFSTNKKVKAELKAWLDGDGKEVTGKFEPEKTYILWLKLTAEEGYSLVADFSEGNVEVDNGVLFSVKNAWDGSETGVFVGVKFTTGADPDLETTPPGSETTPPASETTPGTPETTTPPPTTTTPPPTTTTEAPVETTTSAPTVTTPVPDTPTEAPVTPTEAPAPTEVTFGGADYTVAGGKATYDGPTKETKNVTVPATITVDGAEVPVTAIAPKAFYKDAKLVKVTIGKNVKTIGKQAFASCKKLTTVKGGAAVTKIDTSAFASDVKLKSLPGFAKLTTIGASAFKGCKVLPKITLGAKVKSIGKNAFNGCKKLKTITVKSAKLTTKNVGAAAFKGIYKKAAFKVPAAKKSAYKKLFIKKGAPKTIKVKAL